MGWAVDSNSFIRIYDYSRRKGRRIEPVFFPVELEEYIRIRDSFRSAFEKVLSGIKESVVIGKQLFEGMCGDYISSDKIATFFPAGVVDKSFDKPTIRLIMRLLSDEKKARIYTKLSSVASNISTNGVKWKIDPTRRTRKGKDVYSLDRTDIESYFVCRVIQQTIKERYRIVMNNRSTIVNQVSELITMNSPFSVIRTDIQSFFESIPYDNLVSLLEESKLPQSQILAVIDLLTICRSQFGNKGLPRGIGLSSYLSELFLCDFDQFVKKLDSVIYYNRYVDDIIVVVTEDNYGKLDNANRVKMEMNKKISAKRLSFHVNGTKDVIVSNPSKQEPSCCFDYLGYQFTLTNDSVDMDISFSKIVKYKDRISYAAWSYWNTPSMTIKKRNQLFVDRIRFLSMKTRLNYDKQHVITGLPGRYPLIKRGADSLKDLDSYLSKVCSKMPREIRNSVGDKMKISFQEGFVSKTILKYKDSYIKEITRIWKSL